MNYFPEIQNGCDVWEQVFRRYWEDLLLSSDAVGCSLVGQSLLL